MQLHKANKNLIGINKVTAKVLEITVLDSQLGLAARLKMVSSYCPGHDQSGTIGHPLFLLHWSVITLLIRSTYRNSFIIWHLTVNYFHYHSIRPSFISIVVLIFQKTFYFIKKLTTRTLKPIEYFNTGCVKNIINFQWKLGETLKPRRNERHFEEKEGKKHIKHLIGISYHAKCLFAQMGEKNTLYLLV